MVWQWPEAAALATRQPTTAAPTAPLQPRAAGTRFAAGDPDLEKHQASEAYHGGAGGKVAGGRSRRKKWLVGGLVALAVIIVIAAVGGGVGASLRGKNDIAPSPSAPSPVIKQLKVAQMSFALE